MKHRNKFLFTVPFYLFYVSILVSCSSDNGQQEYVGMYQIDIIKSQWGENNDSSLYKNLKLRITNTDSFYFSHDVPFIALKYGRLEIRSIDGFQWAYLQYGKGQYATREDQVGITKEGDLYINNPRPKEGLQSIPRVVFSRIEIESKR